MGYRHYFYKVARKDVEQIRDMSVEKLFKYAKENGVDVEDGYVSLFDDNFLHQQEVFEFGKLYWDDTADRIYEKGVPLFSQKETQDLFDDYIPYIVGKEGLLEAIKIYREKLLSYYSSLLNDGEDKRLPLGITLHDDAPKSIDKIVEHIKEKVFRFQNLGFVNLDENHKWCVADSWEYEHSIFNLVHILKCLDWEKDTLLFYGW